MTDFWDETEPFGQISPSADLRLPAHVVPSFYRLKLQTDLENSNFTGEVYITIRANIPVKEIILHSKNLSINNNAKLTEQIYEKVETLHTRSKRQTNNNDTLPNADFAISNDNGTQYNETQETEATSQNVLSDNETVADVVPTMQTVTKTSIDTQVTHSSVRNINIVDIKEATGDRLILKLASALTPYVDYTLQLSFSGPISNALTGFYKSTYTNAQNEDK